VSLGDEGASFHVQCLSNRRMREVSEAMRSQTDLGQRMELLLLLQRHRQRRPTESRRKT
jgi:hypothetical protein